MQTAVDIADKENAENKVISSQISDNSSSSKRSNVSITKEKAKPFGNHNFSTPSSTQSTASNQSEIVQAENENTLLIHAVEYGLEVYNTLNNYMQ